MKNTLEQLLSKIGVTPEVVQKARQRQAEQGGFLRENLIAIGELTEETFSEGVFQQIRVPYVNLEHMTISDDILRLLSREQAEKYLALPLEFDERHRRLSIAMADPSDMSAIDELKFVVGYTLIPQYTPEDELLEAIHRDYGRLEKRTVTPAQTSQPPVPDSQGYLIDVSSLVTAETAISQLIGTVFSVAYTRQADEIFIKAESESIRISFRVHGTIAETLRFPKKIAHTLLLRMKRLLRVELGEHPKFFHKGYATLRLQNKKELDISYLIFPATHNDNVLIKIKDRFALPTLQDLDLDSQALQDLQNALHHAYGTILVTGTVHSGVTTTLYALMNTINAPHLNIISIEDPIECQLEGVTQGQACYEAGQMDDTQYVHAILAQHPDVVMFDKVYDSRGIRTLFLIASGTLGLSSLRAVDTASAAIKLVLMSTPQLVADRVTCITSQRLVRRICEHCKENVSLAEAYREKLGLLPEDVCYVGKGCEQCQHTGYDGLIPLFEIMPFVDDIKQAILEGVSLRELRNLMDNKGITSLRHDGMRKVKQGVTTVQEVLKATML